MSAGLLLAVESSCDETGIALIEGGRRILANVVASQVALHAATGAGEASSAARMRATRSRMRGSVNGSVVMIRASSLSSL